MNSESIKIVKVTDGKAMDDFVSLPRKLYKGNNLYIPDLDTDIRGFFNPKKNRSLEFADVQPFVAYKDGKAVGRITGIISHKSNKVWDKKVVRFSHIEFIDDMEVSDALINAVEQWGKRRGMEQIQGPMGITDFDKEGMLVSDFELGGTFLEIWNPSYYVDHMQRMGFVPEADWLQVRINVPKEVPARYARVAKYIREEYKLKVVKHTKKEVMENGFGLQLFKLVNQAYAPLFGFAPFSDDQIDDLLNLYVPLLDLSIVPFVENEQGEVVGFAVTIVDFSEGLRKSKGKLFPTGWFHLLKALKFSKVNKAQLMIIAVRPDMQGLGVNSLIFDDLIPIFNKRGIEWCETGPQLETNVKEMSQWKPLNPEFVKRRRCWIR
ncbi:MAG: N-acetyltransferase [Prevotella sp.]|nr:N-acetyltransferase [Candidatus Prevotella equi]